MKAFFNVVRAALIAVIFSAMAVTAHAGGGTEQTAELNAINDGSASANGAALTWTLATPRGIGSYMSNIAYGNGKFIATGTIHYALGTGRMAYSTDGITWTEDTNSAIKGMEVSFCGGRFFAFGWEEGVLTSTDGITWTKTNIPNHQDFSYTAYGNGKYVIATYQGRIFYSTDGVTWTETRNRPSGYQFQSIAYGGGRFVAVTYNGKIAYSTDGITWTEASKYVSAIMHSVAYGDGKFVVSGWGRIRYSEDGATWAEVDFGVGELFCDTPVWRVVYGGGKFVIIAQDHKAKWHIQRTA